MAITKCPECGKDVSDQAEKCIHCGFPLTVKKGKKKGKDVTTIEFTKKKYKLQLFFCVTLIAIGIIIEIASTEAIAQPQSFVNNFGTVFILAGLIWYVILRIIIWWHHG